MDENICLWEDCVDEEGAEEEKKEDRTEYLNKHSSFKRNRNHSYFCIQDKNEPDEYTVKMMAHNSIQGLLPLSIFYENDYYQYKYEISSLISLKEYWLKQSIGVIELRQILNSIYSCSEILDEYLLDVESLVLSPEYIFYEEKQKTCYFVFFSPYHRKFQESLQLLIQFFMDKVDYRKKKDVEIIYQVFEQLQNPNYQLSEIMKSLYLEEGECKKKKDKIEDEYVLPIENISEKIDEDLFDSDLKKKNLSVFFIFMFLAGIEVVLTVFQLFTGQIFWDKVAFLRIIIGSGLFLISAIIMLIIKVKKKNIEGKEEINIDEVEVLKDEEEIVVPLTEKKIDTPLTTVLNVRVDNKKYQKNYAILKGKNEKIEDIYIHSFSFIVGRVKTVTDAQLNSSNISRMHAKFICEEGKWKIIDLCSTNGTFCNRIRLEAETEYELNIGDEVRLAEYEYIFDIL